MKEWFKLAFSFKVLRRALLTAVIVGTVLVVINYGDAILKGQIDQVRLFRMGLTVVVPYLVSTVSSVATLRSMQPKRTEESVSHPADTNNE